MTKFKTLMNIHGIQAIHVLTYNNITDNKIIFIKNGNKWLSLFFNVDPPPKVKTSKVHNSRPCAPIGCTRQWVGSFHSLETPLHFLQPTYLLPLIHATPNFKWSMYTLTTLNISQLQTFICLFKTALTHTTKQLTLIIYTTESQMIDFHVSMTNTPLHLNISGLLCHGTCQTTVIS